AAGRSRTAPPSMPSGPQKGPLDNTLSGSARLRRKPAFPLQNGSRRHGTPAFLAASGSILLSAPEALLLTVLSEIPLIGKRSISLRASIRAGTAAFASAPIGTGANAALLRASAAGPLRASIRAGTADFAYAPILRSAEAALLRIAGPGPLRTSIRAGT